MSLETKREKMFVFNPSNFSVRCQEFGLSTFFRFNNIFVSILLSICSIIFVHFGHITAGQIKTHIAINMFDSCCSLRIIYQVNGESISSKFVVNFSTTTTTTTRDFHSCLFVTSGGHYCNPAQGSQGQDKTNFKK